MKSLHCRGGGPVCQRSTPMGRNRLPHPKDHTVVTLRRCHRKRQWKWDVKVQHLKEDSASQTSSTVQFYGLLDENEPSHKHLLLHLLPPNIYSSMIRYGLRDLEKNKLQAGQSANLAFQNNHKQHLGRQLASWHRLGQTTGILPLFGTTLHQSPAPPAAQRSARSRRDASFYGGWAW